MPEIDEGVLLQIAVDNLSKIAEFDPYKSYEGVSSKEDFKKLIQSDPAFANLGLANDQYVIARVGGNLITSLHRKIGDMYENMFSYMLQQRFAIPEDHLHFSVNVEINDRTQERSTDGLIPRDKFKENFPKEWMAYSAVGFELRSCYQIGDSKRIQADYDMSLALEKKNIRPVMLIFCSTSLKSPVQRLSKSWELHQGMESFNLIKLITGFDLYGFMETHEKKFSKEIGKALLIS